MGVCNDSNTKATSPRQELCGHSKVFNLRRVLPLVVEESDYASGIALSLNDVVDIGTVFSEVSLTKDAAMEIWLPPFFKGREEFHDHFFSFELN